MSVESNPGLNFAFWPVFGNEGERIFFFFLFYFPQYLCQYCPFFPNETEILIFNQKDVLAILLYSLTQ